MRLVPTVEAAGSHFGIPSTACAHLANAVTLEGHVHNEATYIYISLYTMSCRIKKYGRESKRLSKGHL